MIKKYFFLILFTTTLSNHLFANPTYENAELTIQKMWNSFVEGDVNMFSETMAQDSDMVTFGTDASEMWDSWNDLKESVKLQFNAFDVLSVTRKNKSLKVNKSKTAAWFSETVDWKFLSDGKEESIDGVRYTGVMEYRGGQWLIVQFHSSVGVAGQVIEY
jgi:hypothetical protein